MHCFRKAAAVLLSLCLFVLPLNGCAFSQKPEDESQLKIVATVFPPFDFARAVVGDTAQVTMLLKPGSESHDYEPTPGDIAKIRDCDLFLFVGGESDVWVRDLLESIPGKNRTEIALVDCVSLLNEELEEGMQEPAGHNHNHDHGHNHSHDHGHNHSETGQEETDEHVWTSPVNALKICETIRDACEEKAPQNAESYRENTARYAEELTRLDQDFRTVCETGKRKTLVFGDRFPFRYFAAEYGLTCFAAFPGCAAQTQVSASTLLFLTEKIRQEQLPVVLVLELSNGKIADTLCEETGAEKLLFHSCHNVTREEMAQGETYVSLMRRNLENLKVALN